jgi:hypothetical protein
MCPVSGASEDLVSGGSYLGGYYRIVLPSTAFANKDEDRGVLNWQLTVLSWRRAQEGHIAIPNLELRLQAAA